MIGGLNTVTVKANVSWKLRKSYFDLIAEIDSVNYHRRSYTQLFDFKTPQRRAFGTTAARDNTDQFSPLAFPVFVNL